MSKPEDLIRGDVWRRGAGWNAVFQDAQPFRHIVVDDFLDADFARRLLDEFPSFEAGNSIGDDGRQGGKSTVEKIHALGPAYRQLDELVRSAAFLEWLGSAVGMDALIYDPAYFGGGTHENRHGQELHAHIDFNYHPTERWHRRLNLIVYLNPDWDGRWGGNLELYRDPYVDVRPTAVIAPVHNRCVMFETTEHSWHGFDRIALPPAEASRSRKSVAFYFYTRKRPAEEVAGMHTTHYVNRQLPEHFVAGHTLDGGDVETLRTLIAHRDNLLRRLYAENARLLQYHGKGLAGRIFHRLKGVYSRYRERA